MNTKQPDYIALTEQHAALLAKHERHYRFRLVSGRAARYADYWFDKLVAALAAQGFDNVKREPGPTQAQDVAYGLVARFK